MSPDSKSTRMNDGTLIINHEVEPPYFKSHSHVFPYLIVLKGMEEEEKKVMPKEQTALKKSQSVESSIVVSGVKGIRALRKQKLSDNDTRRDF